MNSKRAAIHRVATLGLVVCGSAVCAPGVAAQEIGDELILEEVVVTARKRTESLQEVPISITAFSAAALERIGAYDISDIFIRTPNLHVEYDGDLKGSPPNIRGVMSNVGTAGADPAVGFYVDEVYMGNNVASSLDFFDVESIEVLRGPQGTLFGRNTIGGVVNIRTKKPGETFNGALGATIGNYDYLRLNGSVSGPIVDGSLYGKFSLLHEDRDGYIKNLNPDYGDLRTQHQWIARSQLRFVASERTEFMLTVDYRDSDRRNGGYQADGDNFFFSGIIPELTYIEPDPLDYKTNNDCCWEETFEGWGIALDVAHSFAGAEFRSITAYRDHEYDAIVDVDLSPNQWVNDGGPEDQSQFSQEFRLTSTDGGVLSWIVGLFYFHQNSLDRNFLTFQQDLLAVLGFPPGIPDLTSQANGDQKTDSYAAYGHIDYRFSERMELALGARVTHDKKDIDYFQTDLSGFFGGSFAFEDSDSWTELTGDATLSYHFTEENMVYASAARGYKAGGFNDGIGEADNPPFDPEYVWSYELGTKNTFASGRLLFNLSAYYLDWKDIQVAGFRVQDDGTFRRITANFGDADSKGLEAELTALLTDNFQVSANLGIADGDSKSVSDNGIVATSSLAGPEYTANLSALYQHRLASAGRLSFYADVSIQGPNDLVPNFDTMGLDLVGPKQDTFGLVNARISYETADGRWNVSAWGKNLTDKQYRANYFPGGGNPLLPPGAAVVGEARMYGVDVRLNF